MDQANYVANGAHHAHAAVQLAAGEVHVLRRQHGHEPQPLGTVAAELVDPVVVGLAEGQGEPRVHVVAREQAQAGRRIEDGDVHALHLHADELASGSYLRWMAKSRRPMILEPDSGCVLLAVSAVALLFLRYCCSSASIVVGRPSMTMVPRTGRPSAPMGRTTRSLNFGSR